MSARKDECGPLSYQPFESLGKLINKSDLRPAGKQKTKKVLMEQDVDEEKLFRDAMKHVREIREFRMMPVRGKRVSPPRKNALSDKEAAVACLQAIIDGTGPINLSHTQEYVRWVRPDMREDIVDGLHQGRFSVQDQIDLHGLTVGEAQPAVDEFVRSSVGRGYRCIKIIHGRGLRSPRGPVLKKAVMGWLSRRLNRHVAAFVSARQCDGGLGAIYVLLK